MVTLVSRMVISWSSRTDLDDDVVDVTSFSALDVVEIKCFLGNRDNPEERDVTSAFIVL